MSGTAQKRRVTTVAGSDERQTVIEFNRLVADVERIRGLADAALRDQVVTTGTTAGISVDANAEDIETDNAIVIQHKGLRYPVAAVSAFDISASGAAAGATITVSTSGVGWVFANTAGALDVEVDQDAQAYASVIAALAAYSTATNTLPPGTDDVPIGAIIVTEGGSGTFTWGTDSLTAETESYVDFAGVPGIETACASFAADASAATFTYGAGVVRLGSGVRVSYTGKANVAITGSNIANGLYGAWLIYVRADDVEFAKQLDNDYASLAAAQAGVRDHNRNPYLAHIGTMYVRNNSGAAFVPGTTNLDATGITTTFETTAALGQSSLAAGTLTAAQVANLAGTVIST